MTLEHLDDQTKAELLAVAKGLENRMKEICDGLTDLNKRLHLKHEKRRTEAVERSRLSQNPPQ